MSNTSSRDFPKRLHMFLPTRVDSTQPTIHWESQPVLDWVVSLANPKNESPILASLSVPSFLPGHQAERHHSLIEKCRIHSNHPIFWNEYQKIQSLHHFLRDKIITQWSATCPEYPFALERLYYETNDRLESLLFSWASIEPLSSSSSSTAHVDVSQYMTAWLRDNWINPYPDDIVLNDLASACGTTPTTIGNWLINARTRKWRPAIIKATQLNRPADRLLEDSLCFFEGKPIRALWDNHDASLHDEEMWESLIIDEARQNDLAVDEPNDVVVKDDDDAFQEDWVRQETVERVIKRPRIE